MKKSLFIVAILLLISSKQIFACNYYEDEKALIEILETGTYRSNVSGKVCSYDKRSVIPIKNGKVNGKVKVFLPNISESIVEAKFKNGKKEGLAKTYYYPSGALKKEVNYVNGKEEGLVKLYYYKFGVLKSEANYKNNEKEGLWKEYDESGKLKGKINYTNGKEQIKSFWIL